MQVVEWICVPCGNHISYPPVKFPLGAPTVDKERGFPFMEVEYMSCCIECASVQLESMKSNIGDLNDRCASVGRKFLGEED